MANKKSNYRSLKAGSETYKLKLSTWGILEFEDNWAKGDSLIEFADKLEKMQPDDNNQFRLDTKFISIKEFVLLFWAALQEYHADEAETIRDAAKIMDKAGGYGEVQEKLFGAMNDAFPDAPEGKSGESENGQSGPKPVEEVSTGGSS